MTNDETSARVGRPAERFVSPSTRQLPLVTLAAGPETSQRLSDDRCGSFFSKRLGEESPNTHGQHAAQNAREYSAKAGCDGKCHRK